MKKLSNHLRQALEDAEASTKPITIKGPMGNAFTEALIQEFKKADGTEEDNKAALESQEIDHSAMSKVAALLTTPDVPQNESSLQIYGLSEAEINDEDIVNVANDMSSLPLDNRDNYVIVMQESPDGSLEESAKELSGAMESLAKAFRVKVYPSLEAFAKHRFG